MDPPEPDDADRDDAGSTVTWRELAGEAASTLAAAGCGSPEVDARWIAEQASGSEGAAFLLAREEPATARGVAAFDAMVARRAAGEPLQYVLGRWGFRDLDLFVDQRVLIPRPETETVVDHALAELDRATADWATAGREATVIDLGTGSGAIALAVATERVRSRVWAVDASPGAVAVARANLTGVGRAAARVRIVEGSWFAPLPERLRGVVDLVVANPPYVASSDKLPAVVADWEPMGALVAGPRGLEAFELIVAEAPGWLAPGGALVVEIGATQGAGAAKLARQAGFTRVEVHADLAGRPRTLVAGLVSRR
ncbi:peptide chain release factor N(5)-glutamine methyltransferase [soil metagenome]